MRDIEPHRFVEALALLPMLHVPQGKKVQVGVVGPHYEIMAAEVRRWPDVDTIYVTKRPERLNDKRVRVVDRIPEKSVDAMLLAPEQDPLIWVGSIRPGGILQASTYDPGKVGALREKMKTAMGNAVPWREYLPTPIYGVMSHIGIGPVKRLRKPPKAAQRLSENYLPCLFTFGRDEIPLVFKQP